MAALEHEHWWFAARRRILAAALRRLNLPAEARILELGCGNGGNLAMLGRFGTVAALEPNGFARATAASSLSRADVRDGLLPDGIPFEPESFDLVVLLDVLEHVQDDAGSLRAALRMAKPGGGLMITVPGYPWLWSAHDVAHHHLRRYREGELLHLVAAAGWRDLDSTRFMTVLLPLVVAGRVISRLLGRDRSDDFMPPAWLNRTLRALFAVEAAWIGRRIPVGVSILVTARRP